jgi:hypothetical protein
MSQADMYSTKDLDLVLVLIGGTQKVKVWFSAKRR